MRRHYEVQTTVEGSKYPHRSPTFRMATFILFLYLKGKFSGISGVSVKSIVCGGMNQQHPQVMSVSDVCVCVWWGWAVLGLSVSIGTWGGETGDFSPHSEPSRSSV